MGFTARMVTYGWPWFYNLSEKHIEKLTDFLIFSFLTHCLGSLAGTVGPPSSRRAGGPLRIQEKLDLLRAEVEAVDVEGSLENEESLK